MKFSSNYVFNAPAAKVWGALMDPQALARCIPGCESLTPDGPGKYRASVTAGIGPIRSRYNATVSLADQMPHQSYRLTIEAQGAMGFGKGQAQVTLTEQGGKTTVKVDGEGQAGGAVARVGQRLMDGALQNMMERFFGCLQQSMK
ncbi:MAG: carbon monoxide dehydrogenase subunit G [SAR202 cluster bacterium]|nr:carbon monoxide dehydrogenase subunit G [SAR202 cluster bacterium]